MSNASAASILAQEEADLLQAGYIYGYCCLAATALIFFEHIVTFSEEVHVIWRARLTTVTVVFALNRYVLMVQGVSNALNPVLWHTPLSCEAVLLLQDVTTYILEVVTASFSAFRTYAISGRQIVTALLVLLLGLVPVGVNVFTNARQSYELVTYVGSYPVCYFNLHESVAIENKPRLAIEVRKSRLRGSIATVLMRDGTLYFMALLLLNILEIVITLRCQNLQNYADYVTVFLPSISSILISRFILNLRQVSLGSVGLNTTSHSSQNTPDFPSRLVGNFGAEVQHTSLVFENVEDNTEDEQNISGDCEAYELAQVQ